MFYFNLFLWNDRRLKPTETLDAEDYFKDGELRAEKAEQFRNWVSD